MQIFKDFFFYIIHPLSCGGWEELFTAATNCRIMTRREQRENGAAWQRGAFFFAGFAEKMPRRVTALRSYRPLTTLTKPFAAVCALPKSAKAICSSDADATASCVWTHRLWLRRPSGSDSGHWRRIVNERSEGTGGTYISFQREEEEKGQKRASTESLLFFLMLG